MKEICSTFKQIYLIFWKKFRKWRASSLPPSPPRRPKPGGQMWRLSSGSRSTHLKRTVQSCQFWKTVQSCQFCRKLYNIVNFVENCAKLSKAQWYFEEECEYFVHNILAKYLGQCTTFDNNITYNLHYKIERRNISNMLKEICSIFWKKYV